MKTIAVIVAVLIIVILVAGWIRSNRTWSADELEQDRHL